MSRRIVSIAVLALCIVVPVVAQTDPGVRGGGAAAGNALSSVLANNPATILNFFNDAKARFQEIDSVSGTLAGEEGVGLGPRYNSRSCAFCHAQPAVGGTSPFTNPQVADATADGARNSVPSFITTNGPVREARFPFFFNTNTPNGGVEPLYTIAGRVDAGGCTTSVISKPDFAFAAATNDLVFRIPTPTFGSGLMENIDDATLLANFNAQQGNSQGVSGAFNRNGNDGTISRFGWKAQNKSLEIFAGEAYNVEQGVSNELFTCVRDYATGANVLYRVEPLLAEHKFNRIPLRITIDTKGRVRHIHFLTAFPQQATIITDALLQWRLKPYVVNGEPAEVETGLVFGGTAEEDGRDGGLNVVATRVTASIVTSSPAGTAPVCVSTRSSIASRILAASRPCIVRSISATGSRPSCSSAAFSASVTPSVNITSESPGASATDWLRYVACAKRPTTMSVDFSVCTPFAPITSGGTWPPFAKSTTPRAGSSTPAKSVTNFVGDVFGASVALISRTRSAGVGSPRVKIANAVATLDITSAAVIPFPLTSAMTK